MQCQRLGCWDAGRSCWLALLQRIKYLCVRHPSYGESFSFVLGGVCGGALWGWPAELHPTPGGKEVYKLEQIESSADIKLIVIMLLDGWEAFEYAWMSPAALHLAGVSGVGLAAMPNGSPTSLLRVSAMSAFGTLPATPLKHLAQHLQVKLAPAPTSFDLVWTLVKHACPELSEDEMWVIMEKRWHSHNMLNDLLPDNLLDQVDERDAQEVKFVKNKIEEEAAATMEFKDTYRAKRSTYVARVREHAAELAKKKRRDARRDCAESQQKVPDPNGDPNFKGKRFPTKYEGVTSDGAAEQITTYLPPEFSVYEDKWNKRWHLRLGPLGRTVSRSWTKYGYSQAAQLIVEEAWRSWHDMGNSACPIAGVVGTTASVQQASGVASSSSGGAPSCRARHRC